MQRQLVLPPDFPDYAWEVEAKGVFWGATVVVGEVHVSVTFYDPVRLSQDVAHELAERPALELRRTLVVSSVTETQMRLAVESAADDFFQ